jgi:histidine triad (HIT) family protein
MNSDCIFCAIVRGDAPSHKIWEDDRHVAFLSIFPNTEGFSVVVTKEHHGSDALAQPDDILSGLTLAAKAASERLKKGFDDVGRVGLILEGFGVDHLHAKLFPMHGTKQDAWKAIKSDIKKFFPLYEGYISSHDFERANDEALAKLARRINSAR